MAARVIQGFFRAGHPRAAVAAQPKAGPRRPAFVPPALPRPAHGATFPVDPGRLGLSGGGKPLAAAVRGAMETALGADFSEVRVHVGPQAERLGALAFTVGSDIYFAPGRFQPDTIQGKRLLGHELAHVLQQRQRRVRDPVGGGWAVVRDPALEAEALRLSQRAATFRPPAGPKIAPASVQRSSPVRKPVSSVIQPAKKAAQKSAVVTLTIGAKQFQGTSSGQYGHAEMSALRTFIVSYDTLDDASDALDGASVKTVECHNQPVCGSCTLVLQALEFEAADEETEFSTEKSGGVSWGASMKVAEFMEHKGLKKTYDDAVRKGAK